MKIEYWKLSRIKPYPKNARKIPDRAVEQVAMSIKSYGWRQPIVVDRKGVICMGHVRLKAAYHLQLAEAPVHVAKELSPEQIRLLRIADNRVALESTWDEGLLTAEMLDLKALDLDLSLTGFSAEELAAMFNPTMPDAEAANRTLAERFIVPPFSVLDARQGYWQERKRAWLALGIQSEIGRGGATSSDLSQQKRLAPGGSLMPGVSKLTGKIVRTDSRARPIEGT